MLTASELRERVCKILIETLNFEPQLKVPDETFCQLISDLFLTFLAESSNGPRESKINKHAKEKTVSIIQY